MLHGMDQLPIKGVTFARFAIAEESTNRQMHIIIGKGLVMHFNHPRCDAFQAKTRNTRRHWREIISNQ